MITALIFGRSDYIIALPTNRAATKALALKIRGVYGDPVSPKGIKITDPTAVTSSHIVNKLSHCFNLFHSGGLALPPHYYERSEDGWIVEANRMLFSKSVSIVETPQESEQNIESNRGFFPHPGFAQTLESHLLSVSTTSLGMLIFSSFGKSSDM